MSTTGKSQKANWPAYEVFTITDEGEAAFWTRIGAAWPNADGQGFNVALTALPLNAKLVLRKPKPKSDALADSEQRVPDEALAAGAELP